MGRRSRPPVLENLQPLEIVRPLHLKGSDWQIIKTDNANTIVSSLYLGAFKPPESIHYTMTFGGGQACWRIKATRRKEMVHSAHRSRMMPQAGFQVELAYHPDGPDATSAWSKPIYRGRATRWPEAVREIKLYASVVDEIISGGKAMYGNREQWLTLRPFRVQFPWDDPREPNAKYSAFQLAGAFRLEETTDGSALSIRRNVQANGAQLDLYEVRKMCKALDANAFLVQELDGSYFVYHRADMTQRDPIDIDDWRARVVAGSDETFDKLT